MSEKHNHITRDINPVGDCSACDLYHAKYCSELYLFEIKKLKAENAELKSKLGYAEKYCEFQNKKLDKFREQTKESMDAMDSGIAGLTFYKNKSKSQYDQITKLTHQRDTLKKALEFYANKDNFLMVYTSGHCVGSANIEERISREPIGFVARKALQDVEGKKK